MSEKTDITISELALVVREGEPRALDLDIGERLGLQRPRVIRELIERNRSELEGFGPLAVRHGKSRGQDFAEYLLTEEQALLISTLSSAPNAPAVRAMLIRSFVAWRRGHLPAELPSEALEILTRTNGICRMTISKITEMEKALPVMAAQIASELLPAMLKTAMASQTFSMRRGRTAGEIWRESGFPKIKVTSWFSNRLAQMGCQIEGGGCGELGGRTAKLFDPDKARTWLDNGGRVLVTQYLAERQGQKVLRLVPKDVPGEQPSA